MLRDAAIALHGYEELAERAAHDPRDLHLGDPQAAPDLVLVQVLLEAKPENTALALVERSFLGGETRWFIYATLITIAVRLSYRPFAKLPGK